MKRDKNRITDSPLFAGLLALGTITALGVALMKLMHWLKGAN